MSKFVPWLHHPDLKSERLIHVATLIAQGRNDALDRFEPSIGDDSWSLGCRAYRCGRFRIEEAIESNKHPWLTALDSSMQFTFKIGTVPVRFYRGLADEPTQRTLKVSYPELQQMSLALSEMDDSTTNEPCFRFAVETDLEGEIDRIIFVGIVANEVKYYWEIPFTPKVRLLHSIGMTREEGVELPSPHVSDRVESDKADQELSS